MNKNAEQAFKLIEAEENLKNIVDELKSKRAEVSALKTTIIPTEQRIGELEMDIWDLGEQYIVARRKVDNLKGVKL